MKPVLHLSEHGIVTPLRITPRYPLCGVVHSIAWLFDGETLRMVNIARHGSIRTRDLIWSP